MIIATLMTLASLAVAAVMILAVTAAEIFEKIAPALGVIVPIIVALLVRYETKANIKMIVTLVITGGVAIASIALADWSMFTWGLLFERAMMTLGEAQLVYFVVKVAVERWLGAESINQLGVFLPDKGVV